MIRDLLKKLIKREPARPAPAAASSPVPKVENKGNLAKEGERPWYLDGQADVDGWDATDVKKPE